MDSDTDNGSGELKIGFEMSGKTVKLAEILPSHKLDAKHRASRKYATIVASIREVGIIEPPIVHSLDDSKGGAKYLLLDGHMRIEALKEIGLDSVFCLLSTDDETYTYNNKVNQVTPIQEHFMILNAIQRGVSEQRIASALKVDIGLIRQKRNLLNGVCPEAVEMLKDVTAGAMTIRQLKRVKPSRQIEIVEMMLMVSNFSSVYCEALIAATPKDQLADLSRKVLAEYERQKRGGAMFDGGGTMAGHLNCYPGESSRFAYEALRDQGILDVVAAVAPKAAAGLLRPAAAHSRSPPAGWRSW